MRQAAYILNIITCVLLSWLLIPLAWLIPMTIASKKAIGDGQDHIALGVCTLLFSNLLSGIFILVEK
jgi:hypothetical protein